MCIVAVPSLMIIVNSKIMHRIGQQMDLNNYKGIYYQGDTDQKYFDPITGAHFEYNDLYRRLSIVYNSNRTAQLRNTPRVKQAYSEKRKSQPEIKEKIDILRPFEVETKNCPPAAIFKSIGPSHLKLNATTKSKQDFANVLKKLYLTKFKSIKPQKQLPYIERKKSVLTTQNDFNFVSLDLRKNNDSKNLLSFSKGSCLHAILSPHKPQNSRNKKDIVNEGYHSKRCNSIKYN